MQLWNPHSYDKYVMPIQDNYRAESRNFRIPADQVKPNATKKFVVSVQDQ